MTDRPHLSPSAIDLYCKCPEAYRRRYLEGELIPPGVAIAKGKGVHGGAQTNFRQKLISHADLAVSDIVDASVAAFEAEVDFRELAFSSEEAGRGVRIVLAEAKDDVAEMASVHGEQQAPDYQPVMVEQQLRVTIPDSTHDLLGYVDLVADSRLGRVVADFKTGRKSKAQADADTSTQLTYYAAATTIQTGVAPDAVLLDVLVQQAKGVKRQRLVSQRGAADYAALSHRVNAVLAGVKAGVFPPTVPGAWWCSDRWCGYHATCPYVR